MWRTLCTKLCANLVFYIRILNLPDKRRRSSLHLVSTIINLFDYLYLQSMDDPTEIEQKLLRLTAEIAEATDRVVPTLLLEVRGTLNLYVSRIFNLLTAPNVIPMHVVMHTSVISSHSLHGNQFTFVLVSYFRSFLSFFCVYGIYIWLITYLPTYPLSIYYLCLPLIYDYPCWWACTQYYLGLYFVCQCWNFKMMLFWKVVAPKFLIVLMAYIWLITY